MGWKTGVKPMKISDIPDPIPRDGLLAEYLMEGVSTQLEANPINGPGTTTIFDTSGNGYDITSNWAGAGFIETQNGQGRNWDHPPVNITNEELSMFVCGDWGSPGWLPEIHLQPFSISFNLSRYPAYRAYATQPKQNINSYGVTISGGSTEPNTGACNISIYFNAHNSVNVGSPYLLAGVGQANVGYVSPYNYEFINKKQGNNYVDVRNVVLTSEGVGNYKLYGDGKLLGYLTQSIPFDITTLDPPTCFGGLLAPNSMVTYDNGAGLCNCDQIRIYNRPLTDKEIWVLSKECEIGKGGEWR